MPNMTIYKNATVMTDGKLQRADLCVADGKIAALSSAPMLSEDGSAHEVDCSGLFIFPGFIDVHIHTREPGFLYKETVATASAAAAAGGYTAVCPMANLNPVPDDLASLQVQLDCIARDATVEMRPYGAITKGEQGEKLADMAAMAPYVAGFSDDGRGVQNEEMMRAAMIEAKRFGRPIVAHCEDNGQLKKGGCVHDGAFAAAHGLVGINSKSEWIQLARDIALVEEIGCAYHACHISTKESVALIREAKARGVNITAETGPHYLVLCDEDMKADSEIIREGDPPGVRYDTEGRFKMNPPLRSAADRAALIEGILDGTLDMIATDHAPHSYEEKARGYSGAFGVVGLETAFPIMYTNFVRTGRMSLEKLIHLMHDAPAKRFGLGGDITVGADADFTVYDLNEKYIVDPDTFQTKGRFTPFFGAEVYGRCRMTVRKGMEIWKSSTVK